ncbi:hypothetical protein J4Q44_G00026450 [Coregonus suidteri]|uniref:Uncharacterized protein n=1 Tax=Coregonus suidteri TaxID=861788 RepID=A0AAN8M8U1_9TELE
MPIKDPYSYSSAVGQGGGTPFASSGEGRITAVRVWENNNYYYYYYYNNNAYINGFQLRYSNTWSPVLCSVAKWVKSRRWSCLRMRPSSRCLGSTTQQTTSATW